ncbi:MAG: hypothetical protein HY010_01635 [Acidobacteria bacterium]|nr:hypothetical protein [Acidobacteriota bacterium]
MWMRVLGALLMTGCAIAQAPDTSTPAGPTQPATGQVSRTTSAISVPESTNAVEGTAPRLVIPSGTKVPLALKQAISTRNAKEGDPVYCVTTFPFVVEDRIIIPAGTYVQGKISRVQRPGRIKGRAELLMHFTSMIYPSGYTVMLPGSLDNIPGADKTSIKGSEGTVRQDSDRGKDIGTVASTASTGAVIGGLSAGGKGAGLGAAAGGLAGLAIAMISRGNDVKLEPGTSIEMIIQREVSVDPSRITSRREVIVRE